MSAQDSFRFGPNGMSTAIGDDFTTRWGAQAYDLGYASWEQVYAACAGMILPGGLATPHASTFRKLHDAKRGPSAAVRISMENAGFDVRQCECGVSDGVLRVMPWHSLSDCARMDAAAGAARAPLIPHLVFSGPETMAALSLRAAGPGAFVDANAVHLAFWDMFCRRVEREPDHGERFCTDEAFRHEQIIRWTLIWTGRFGLACTQDDQTDLIVRCIDRTDRVLAQLAPQWKGSPERAA
jgi:hypothetical protein